MSCQLTWRELLVYFNLRWTRIYTCSFTALPPLLYSGVVNINTSLMIEDIPSSFEYRLRRAFRRIGGRDVFNVWLWRRTRPRQFISRREKDPPRSDVSDILPGIVAQVKREVGSPFLYYSRWITRPLSHSLQFKCNEPHRYIPSYSFSGSPFSPPLTPTHLLPSSYPLGPRRDVIPHNPDIFHHYSSGRSDGGQIINFSRN